MRPRSCSFHKAYGSVFTNAKIKTQSFPAARLVASRLVIICFIRSLPDLVKDSKHGLRILLLFLLYMERRTCAVLKCLRVGLLGCALPYGRTQAALEPVTQKSTKKHQADHTRPRERNTPRHLQPEKVFTMTSPWTQTMKYNYTQK